MALITLYCDGCDMPHCRLGQLTYQEKAGCVRQVDDDLYCRYMNLTQEL